MAIVQALSRRKTTGGRYKKRLVLRRKYELGRAPSMIKLGEIALKKIRTRGGNEKIRLREVNQINVVDLKAKKHMKTKVLAVLESPANRHYVRRHVITKGAVVDTELGRVKVTNKLGQDGVLNGVLI